MWKDISDFMDSIPANSLAVAMDSLDVFWLVVVLYI